MCEHGETADTQGKQDSEDGMGMTGLASCSSLARASQGLRTPLYEMDTGVAQASRPLPDFLVRRRHSMVELVQPLALECPAGSQAQHTMAAQHV